MTESILLPTSPRDPHACTSDQVLSLLASNPESGLSSAEAERRLTAWGPNTLRTRKSAKSITLLLNQFESPVVWLLAAAALIAFLFGEWKEATTVVIVLVINAAIGFVTELRAVRSMEALRGLASLTTRVRRDGHAQLVAGEDLVPGDIVLLEGGDRVTADLRLLEASNLSADESMLTGESVAVSKRVQAVEADLTMGDRASMVYKGASLASGTGIGIVVATGMASELGKISKLVEEATPEHSPLERQLQRLSGQLIRFTLLIVALIAAAGMIAGRDIYLMIESAIALAVAAIPEGLPIVATMALARGMWRMAKQNALIERLSAVETLGATTIILTDKTGTLTENRMRLRELDLPDGFLTLDHASCGFVKDSRPIAPSDLPNLGQALVAMVLCNNAELDEAGKDHTGDPLEVALLEAGRVGDMRQTPLLRQHPKVAEVAFDSDSRKMATMHGNGDALLVCVKGAPEAVLENATAILNDGKTVPLSPSDRQEWNARTNAMAGRGMRVLALATKQAANADEPVYEGLTFLGLLGLHDPPRAEVRNAIARCHDAGIRVVMITGDHAATASAIAAQIGLSGEQIRLMEGRTLKSRPDLTHSELENVRKADVFARVSPAQKLDLVSIYQADGEIVAMTGDGVNDAPALKKADIGVAMGLRGTQVAREAATMVLRDDAFGTIVSAIREGRVIFSNIQRFVMYLLSCNLSEVLVVGLAIMLGLPLPLLPLQILFLNLVTDIFPAFALGLGEEDGHVLNDPPRDPRKSIVTRSMWLEMIGHSISITLATLGALVLARFVFLLDRQETVTVSFLTLAFAQLWHVFNMRDARSGWVVNAVSRNPFVWAALTVSSAFLLAVVFIEPFAEVLELQPPSMTAWNLIIAMSLAPLIPGQIGKAVTAYMQRRKNERKA